MAWFVLSGDRVLRAERPRPASPLDGVGHRFGNDPYPLRGKQERGLSRSSALRTLQLFNAPMPVGTLVAGHVSRVIWSAPTERSAPTGRGFARAERSRAKRAGARTKRCAPPPLALRSKTLRAEAELRPGFCENWQVAIV